jgi:Ca-activated chloride channel homolog
MNWNQNLGSNDYLFIALFLGLYAFYFIRMFWLAYRLKTTARAVGLKFFLRTTYFGFLMMALMAPSFGDTEGTIKAEGKDLMFVVDISKSMDTPDVQPSRMQKLKFELSRIVEQFKGIRQGLIIFKGEALVQSPLTFDQSALQLFVSTLNTQALPDQGTDLAVALQLATDRLLSEKNNRKNAKILILMSDGEDFGGSYSSTLARLKRAGVKVFTVGFGTEAGGQVVENGKPAFDNGEPIISRFNGSTLQRIASDTRGRYLRVSDRLNDIPTLVKEIGELKGNVVDERQVSVTANKYYYFLLLALVLMALDVIFTVRTLSI